MTRSSPGVHRVAAILNFIADHPGQSFALTDIVRAVKLSRATCHALLTGLVEVGFLYRSTDKTYVMGPALARIGRSVAEHVTPLQVAQPEMRSLADEFDVICSAYTLEGDAAVVRDRAAAASHAGYAVPLGTRMNLRPESAAAFLAWSPAEEAERWLASLPAPASEAQRDTLQQRMAAARALGFVMILRDAAHSADGVAYLGDESTGTQVSSATEIDPAREYHVASMLMPVFDTADRVAFALGLGGFRTALTGAQVLDIAQRLREACGRVSAFIGGR